MSKPEFPPQDKLTKLSEEERQEHLNSIEILKQKEIDKKETEEKFEYEVGEQTINNKHEIEKVLNEAVAIAKETADKISPKPMAPELIEEDEIDREAAAILQTQVSSRPRSGTFNKLKTGVMTFLGLGVAASAAHAGTGIEKNPSDSSKNNMEQKVSKKTPTDSVKTTVPLYTKSNTKEGGITPTGLSNSFYENEFGIAESDISILAKQYGFSTESPLTFQSDVVDYLVKNHPDIIEGVIKKYGETNKGEGIEGLKDNMLGARTAFMMGFLKNGSAKLIIDGKEKIYTTSPSPTLEGGPQPSGGSFFNTDGYEKLVVLFDNSPSMYSHKAFLAEKLASNKSDVPVDVTTFTDTAGSGMTFATAAQASEQLAKIATIDQQKELAVDVLLKKLQSMDTQSGKTKVVVCTDEKLQDVSQEKLTSLQTLSSEKHVDVVFSVIVDEKPYTLTIEDVQESFKELKAGFEKSIQLRERQIKEFQAEMQTSNNKQKKDFEKRIEETKSEIDYYRGFLNAPLHDLSEFKKDQSSSSVASN